MVFRSCWRRCWLSINCGTCERHSRLHTRTVAHTESATATAPRPLAELLRAPCDSSRNELGLVQCTRTAPRQSPTPALTKLDRMHWKVWRSPTEASASWLLFFRNG